MLEVKAPLYLEGQGGGSPRAESPSIIKFLPYHSQRKN